MMILSRKKIWTINFSTSVGIVFLLISFHADLISTIHNFLESINKPIAYSVFSVIDAVVISLIPIWSYFLYSYKTHISLRDVILANLTTLFSMLITCIIAFMLMATFIKGESPLIPDYVVYIPFPSVFWTVMFLVGGAMPLLLNKLFGKKEIYKTSEALDSNAV